MKYHAILLLLMIVILPTIAQAGWDEFYVTGFVDISTIDGVGVLAGADFDLSAPRYDYLGYESNQIYAYHADPSGFGVSDRPWLSLGWGIWYRMSPSLALRLDLGGSLIRNGRQYMELTSSNGRYLHSFLYIADVYLFRASFQIEYRFPGRNYYVTVGRTATGFLANEWIHWTNYDLGEIYSRPSYRHEFLESETGWSIGGGRLFEINRRTSINLELQYTTGHVMTGWRLATGIRFRPFGKDEPEN